MKFSGYGFVQQDEPNNCLAAGKEKACLPSPGLDTQVGRWASGSGAVCPVARRDNREY